MLFGSKLTRSAALGAKRRFLHSFPGSTACRVSLWCVPVAAVGVAFGLTSSKYATVCQQAVADETKEANVKVDARYRCYRRDGSPCTWEELMKCAKRVPVVLFGEVHDDPVAHELELKLLQGLAQPRNENRTFALSLEMLERDVQHVVDEYTAGIISLNDFEKDGRVWPNFNQDYQPLVDYARDNGISVIAANAPRRYASLVGKKGPDALQAVLDLDGAAARVARENIASVPCVPCSDAYTEKFYATMEGMREGNAEEEGRGCPHIGLSRRDVFRNMLHTMELWDTTMAFSIAQHLTANPGGRVLHICGSFHCEYDMGIKECIPTFYKETLDVVSVCVVPEEDINVLSGNEGRADFIVLTDESIPRSFQIQHPV